jgi:peptidoglycan pentaglycine glycine transferase (the first glycine)
MIIKETTNKEEFDPSLYYKSSPFTQAFFYGDWHKKIGRDVRRFLILNDDLNQNKILGVFQIISYSLPFNKKLLYVPYGPIIFCDITHDLLLEIKKNTYSLAKKENAIFARLDFSFSEKNKIDFNLFKKLFITAPTHTYHSSQFQPRNEWYLDLAKSEEDILRDMHKNTRYSIRVAEKSGVSTKIIENNLSYHFDVFYNILKETAGRDGFNLHSKDYYKNIFNQCDQDKNAILIISSFLEKVLSVNLIILYGDTGMFAFGGTSNEDRKVMPAYSSQYKTIKYLKDKGYRWYNFGGVSEKNDKYNNWRGLTSFKKRFGGHVVKHEYLYDVIAQPFWYFVYYIYNFFR